MATEKGSIKICKVEGCNRDKYKVGYCNMHYQRVRTHGEAGPPQRISSEVRGICSIEGCGKIHDCHGYCSTHNQRIRSGKNVGTAELHRRVKGTGTFRRETGYHSVGKDKNLQYMHRLIAEKVLGHALLKSVVVHHVDGNPSNNEHSNLVICENQAYHRLLHRRQNALDACGNANWRKCECCSEYDDPSNMRIVETGATRKAYHMDCARLYRKSCKAKKLLNNSDSFNVAGDVTC